MKPFHLFGIAVSLWVVVPVFYLTWIFIGLAVKKLAFTWLRRITSRTATQIDDVLIGAAELPVTLMVFVWGLAALAQFVGPDYLGRATSAVVTGSKIATLLAVILFVDRLLLSALRAAAPRYEVVSMSQAFGTVLIHGVVFCLGGLMLLDSIGVSITPLIASLGIGSLAVALALQPTLENFFSGFQILTDRPIRPGQFIKLESGEEGFVESIGWRSTWIRLPTNNMVIIPNKQIVNQRVVNYHYPTPEVVIVVPVGVHYASDLEKVERVTVEVAEDVQKRVAGAVPDFKPLIRYHAFNASSIDFSVIMRAKDINDIGLIKHEFIKSLNSRYNQEKIVIPYPTTAINTSQEAAVFRSN